MSHIYLQRAIRNNEVVAFTYQNIPRIVEPYTLGLNADGQITLTAWQVSGGKQVGWHDFLIDKIRGASPTGLYFRDSRAGYNPAAPTMKHVLAQFKPLGDAAVATSGTRW